ncbi:MAG: hypothetical protein ACRCYU_11350 [Nocardioides sp.]
MATPPPRASIDAGNYQRAGLLAGAGSALLAMHAAYAGVTGEDLPVALQISPFFLSAAVVVLAVTVTAVRGRNLGIALGMTGSVTGVAAGLAEAIRGTPGPLFAASTVLACTGALIVGLSFPKPRLGYPKYAVYAALSGAVLLILLGAIGILTDDRYAAVAYLAPAIGWGWLGRVLLGSNPLPTRSATLPPVSPSGGRASRAGQSQGARPSRTQPARTQPARTQPARTQPAGGTKARPKRKPRKRPRRR